MAGALPLKVLYRDERLLAVDKPSGLLVHRGWGDDSVVAMTLARDLIGQHVYPVHRLDRGTSGVLLFALSSEVAARLRTLFEAHAVEKTYHALVRGKAPDFVSIDHPIPKSEDGPRVAARTDVRRLFYNDGYSWVEARPFTGRLHQIRRHLKHISHPIVGDVNYGKGVHNRLWRERFGLHRLALHASSLALSLKNEPILIRADIPDDLAEPLKKWGYQILTR